MDHAASLDGGAEAAALQAISFADIDGWAGDDHSAAFAAFRAGAVLIAAAPPKTRALRIDGRAVSQAARESLRAPGLDRIAAREFFEANFIPHAIETAGFVTGYYEPEVDSSLVPTGHFNVPLFRRPSDLVEIPPDERPAGWDPGTRFARLTADGIVPYFDRAAIEQGALAGQGLELAWLEDPVDAFFIHVQGSARLRLSGGGTMRIGFDGKTGHAYTSIGRLAVERGLLTLTEAHKEGLEDWLKSHPAEGRALMRENRSFIFFRVTDAKDPLGPIGAAGVPLSAGRSLAVDRTLHTFHVPIWVDAAGLRDPSASTASFRRLMIAQDTGSAIVGAARGDIFFGSGDAAGSAAGRVRHNAKMIILVPHGSADAP